MLRTRFAAAARAFVRQVDGGMTVEWIAIAAGVIAGAVMIARIVMNGLATPAAQIGSALVSGGG